ncbi:MAG: hypothetical protein JO097_03845 [Acidobacteriaceae bacterium]|nr:hypothetical protein [Acidobacteriaceae bacterium]MBV9295083.1 hypothetical protein [Acidobacteriaceae bacterium]MBV9765104.1 hypothetical protein [Acidobacteriaceae bacterium]
MTHVVFDTNVIVSAVGPTRVDDAYHLWTAEEAGLDAFLTMDYQFQDAVTQQRQAIASPVEVLRPVELLEHLRI